MQNSGFFPVRYWNHHGMAFVCVNSVSLKKYSVLYIESIIELLVFLFGDEIE
jgi:hypothetical protein